MTKILNINSIIEKGKWKGKKVEEIISINKKTIFSLIKEGYLFSDEVLSKAGIKKRVKDVKIETVIIPERIKDNTHLEKDAASLSKILKELHTIDNAAENFNEKETKSEARNDSNCFKEKD